MSLSALTHLGFTSLSTYHQSRHNIMTPPINTFPLPDEESDLNALADHINAVGTGTTDVINQLRSGMVGYIAPIQQTYDAINTRINRAISSQMRPINTAHDGVIGSLAADIDSRLSEIGVQAGMIDSMMPEKVGASMPIPTAPAINPGIPLPPGG